MMNLMFRSDSFKIEFHDRHQQLQTWMISVLIHGLYFLSNTLPTVHHHSAFILRKALGLTHCG